MGFWYNVGVHSACVGGSGYRVEWGFTNRCPKQGFRFRKLTETKKSGNYQIIEIYIRQGSKAYFKAQLCG